MPANYLDRWTTPYLTPQNAESIYEHLHNLERWYGATAGNAAPAVAMPASGAVPFRLTASGTANAFGTAVAVIDGSETLGLSFQTMYDFHRLLVQTTSGTGLFTLRFAFNANGEASYTDAVTNNHYTDVVFNVESSSARSNPVDVMMGQVVKGAATGKVWAACACTTASRTVDFFFGLHFYPARPS